MHIFFHLIPTRECECTIVHVMHCHSYTEMRTLSKKNSRFWLNRFFGIHILILKVKWTQEHLNYHQLMNLVSTKKSIEIFLLRKKSKLNEFSTKNFLWKKKFFPILVGFFSFINRFNCNWNEPKVRQFDQN